MLNILHIHPDQRMAEKFVLPLIQHEKTLGYSSELIVFEKYNTKSSAIVCNLNYYNLMLPIQCIKFLYVLYTYKPDLIFCHNSIQATIPLALSKLFKIKKIIYFNHGLTFLGYQGILRNIFYNLERLNAFLSHITLTVSKDMKYELDKIKPKTFLIHNGSACGIDLSIFSKKQRKKGENRKIKVIYIGRFKKRKGSLILLEIINYFYNHENIEFIFCGFTDQELFKISKRQYKNVKCIGFRNNILKILDEGDIFILPSFHEGLSYAVLEAMAKGLFIIANNIPGVNSLVINNYNGILIDDNSPKLFIKEIEKIISNRKLLKRFSNNHLSITKKFDRVDFLFEYSKFLNQIKE